MGGKVDGFKVQESGVRVSPWGVLPFDCVRKRFSGFYRFYGFRGEGAAQKIMKRRGVLIALRVVVISSVALDPPCRTVSMLTALLQSPLASNP